MLTRLTIALAGAQLALEALKGLLKATTVRLIELALLRLGSSIRSRSLVLEIKTASFQAIGSTTR